MKVLCFISTLSGGGAERVMSTVANYFASVSNYDVTLVTDVSEPIAYELSHQISLQDIERGKSKYSGLFSHPRHFVRTVLSINRYYHQEKPDVVISFQTGMNGMVNLSLLFTNAIIISSEHSYYNWKYSRFEELLRKLFYWRSNALTVLTRHDLRVCRERKMKNVVFMPNPIHIDEDGVHPTERNTSVLAAGRLDAWEVKGFDMLIQIWGKVCRDFPNWTLQIAGAGSDTSAKYLYDLSEKYKCINIEFLGFRKDIKQILRKTPVFVLTSRHEGSPMVLLEAMLSGCCCVAFNCETGPDEIIKDNKSGILVEADNVEQFASSLSLVLSNGSLRERFAQNAPDSVSRFGEDRVMKRWEILINKVL